MKSPSVTSRILLVLGATLMLALSATIAWGAVLDYQQRGLVPSGVTIVGKDLSGMTEAEARQAIEEAVSTPMLRPLVISGDSKVWTFDPKGVVAVDTGAMLNEAYSPRRSATFVTRVSHQLMGEPLPADIKPIYTVDTTAVTNWVAQTAQGIDRKPVSATRTLGPKYTFKITPAVYGAALQQSDAAQRISTALTADAALASDSREVTLPVKVIKPKVLESSFKTGIIVSLDQCKIYLYNGDKLVKTYMCAPGRPGFPTPTGDFQIDSKQRFASWINPGSDWAKSMPAVIGPGPNNPMGVTKIGIDFPGVFFHGVPPGEFSSIGTHASHGCMRMMPSAVLDLFGRVKLKDPVFIRE